MFRQFSSIGLMIVLFFQLCPAQRSDIYVPRNIQQGYDTHTRSRDGRPGKNYWQNRADYHIAVELHPQTRLLTGSEQITYFNNSPDTLQELVMHLFYNIYKRGIPREEKVYAMDEHDGMIIDALRVNGEMLTGPSKISTAGFLVEDYLLYIFRGLEPHKQVSIHIDWHFTVNRYSHIRSGAIDSTSFFIAYFFPRMAVYDDIDGWNEFWYTGTSEFYNDFGDFELQVSVPRNYVVWATGLLQNANDVLQPEFSNRYQKALSSDQILPIIDSTECTSGEVTRQQHINTWIFKAENVTDVAFGTSDHYLWDASSLEVDSRTGRRVLIDAAYDKHSRDFYQVAQLARDAIHYMSTDYPGVPFPFPQETVFNGLSEMEYPMMVNDFSTRDPHYLIKVTSHEIFHSYFPFYTGLNETKYAWMDEGLTSYGEYRTVQHLDSPEQADFYFYDSYKRFIGHDWDMPIIANTDFIKPPLYDFNSYVKPAVFYMILNDELGDPLFKKNLREFIYRWKGKHPTPWDFFFTFMNVSGENLDWLIKPWFFEYGYMDLAVTDISQKTGAAEITIEKIGHYPGPISLKVIFTDGSEQIIEKKASVWKNNRQIYTVNLKIKKQIKSAELINQFYLDANLSNNKFDFKK